MKILPKADVRHTVVQYLAGEILIYNLKTHHAFCLNETASIVYHACDGRTSFDDLKQRHRFSDELIFLALYELKRKELIESFDTSRSPLNNLNRRETIRRVGLASFAALPVITNLVAPKATNALSVTCVGDSAVCLSNNFTQSNCCPGQRCYSNVSPSICAPCVNFIFASCAQVGGCPNCSTTPRKNACCSGAGTSMSGSCYCA